MVFLFYIFVNNSLINGLVKNRKINGLVEILKIITNMCQLNGCLLVMHQTVS